MNHLPIWLSRGSSFTHPTDTDPTVKQPRFFYSELSAKRALSSWLQEDPYSAPYKVQEGTEIIKQENRIKPDMKIVQITWEVIDHE